MKEISDALNLEGHCRITGSQYLPSKYAVTELASNSIAAVGEAMASLIVSLGLSGQRPSVEVDRRLASLWFGYSIHPIDWRLPPIWDAIAGDYQTRDGWIRLHTNLPHHCHAALSVLELEADREQVSQAVSLWEKDKLETAIVEAGGVAAAMKSRQEWLTHPQGAAVAAEPLIHWEQKGKSHGRQWLATLERPLKGLRVLDLTRVLAGPVASRTLAGFGANVLRIDPPEWDEPNVVPDVTIGKHCARLDLTNNHGREVFEQLLSEADILIHGYRPGALDKLGYSETKRHALSPELIEVTLNAYGWSGPWSQRRGFDSLVQMSAGIADAGMHWADRQTPTPLPVQALDHATGYLMAAAAIRAITNKIENHRISHARLSLARTAELLCSYPQKNNPNPKIEATQSDFSSVIERNVWGQANRLKPALTITDTPMKWDLPANKLGSSPPLWI